MNEETPDPLHGIKGKFFFQGKFFDESQETDFWKFVHEWPNKKLDQETAERLFKIFSKDCIMNLFLTGKEMTNGNMSKIMESLFYQFIQSTRKNELDKS